MYFNDDLRIQKVAHNEVTNVATIEWFEDGGPGKASLITSNPGNHCARYAPVLVTAKRQNQWLNTCAWLVVVGTTALMPFSTLPVCLSARSVPLDYVAKLALTPGVARETDFFKAVWRENT